MDKKEIEEKLEQLVETMEVLQEPVRRVFDDIEALLDQSKGTNSLELIEFQLKLNSLLERFYGEMADAHDRIIEDLEAIEDYTQKN